MNTCLICGRGYSAPPTMSHTDNQNEICSVCEFIEAFRAAKDHISRGIADAVEQTEFATGSVEALS